MAVLDLGLPGGNGAEPIGDLQAANLNVDVLILSAGFEPHTLTG
jgi:DNA-binding NarL/FixJ family response regulator